MEATVERGSDKHGFRLDDAMSAEVEGLVRSGHNTHKEEWRESEPSGEDQPEVDLVPEGSLEGGSPDGMTGADVEGRSELAGYLGKDVYPANRAALEAKAADAQAPDRVIDLINRLPADREFANVSEIWTALGGGVEQHRF
jgi:hypothetical protein